MKYELNEREVAVLKTELDEGAVYVLAAAYSDDNSALDEYDLQKLEVIYQSELHADATADQIEAALLRA